MFTSSEKAMRVVMLLAVVIVLLDVLYWRA